MANRQLADVPTVTAPTSCGGSDDDSRALVGLSRAMGRTEPPASRADQPLWRDWLGRCLAVAAS